MEFDRKAPADSFRQPIRIHMNKILTVAFFSFISTVLGSIASLAQRQTLSAEELQERVGRLVAPLVESGTVVGLSIGMIDGDRKWTMGYGYTTPDRTARPDGTTMYEIGSISKTFTGILLADAVQRGRMKLDDRVSKYLPESLRSKGVGASTITLLDLATHHSGLPSLPDNFAPGDPTNPYIDYTSERLLEYLPSYSPPAGSKPSYEYSNLGAGLLGWLMARQAGTDYPGLLRRVTSPLGMINTATTFPPQLSERVAAGHDADGNVVPNWDFAALAGAGAIRSNIEDMLLYLNANLGATKTSLRTAIDAAQKPQRQLPEGGGSIGLGWHILPNGKVIWHNGGTGGYHSLMAFNREKRQGVVVLANTSSELIDRLGFDLLALLGGANPDPIEVPKVVRLDTTTLERYVGVYRFAPTIVMTITRERDKLFAMLTGQSPLRIYPSSETAFFLRAVDARITFERGENGEIASLTLDQGGARITAPKER
jgi:serine-type D-Ala-D-Ala carboxypeptidase/endopeptidase